MPYADVGAMPGWGAQVDALYRRIWWTIDEKRILPGGVVISGALARDPTCVLADGTPYPVILQAGLVMGKVTAAGANHGLYAPSVIGLSTAPVKDTDTSISVAAATAAEVLRRIGPSGTLNVTGPNAAGQTPSTTTVTFTGVTVNGSAGSIAITAIGSHANQVDFVSGSFIQPTDGSQQPLCLVTKQDGISVTDRLGNPLAQVEFPEPTVGGAILAPQIVNYPADSGLCAWLKAQLRAVGGPYLFSDDF